MTPAGAGGRPRILVIGAGSIGSRHARNLAAQADVVVTDADPDRLKAIELPTRPLALDRPDDLADFDGVVVASPTQLHAAHASLALQAGAYVLIEKPIAEDTTQAEQLVADHDGRIMVGYNLRLHAPIEELMRLVHSGRAGDVLAHRLWFGSWLPDWRPDVDYRTTYSARSNLGGGVLNDAIHELDLALWLTGEPLHVQGSVVARLGPLEIDVEDTVRALLTTTAGVPVTIELDYLSRQYRRGIEVVGTDATISLDWATHTITIRDQASTTEIESDTPVAESYVREAERFVELITDQRPPPVDGKTGLASLALADAIRAAAT